MTDIALPVRVSEDEWKAEAFDANGEQLFGASNYETSVEDAREFTKEIAHRINLYPELLAALKAVDTKWTEYALNGLGLDGEPSKFTDELVVIWNRARAAIAKATKEETP